MHLWMFSTGLYHGDIEDPGRLRTPGYVRGYGVPLDDVLINMAATGPDPVSDEVVRRDEAVRLYEAISKLTPIQRRRVMMLLEDMNCWQIAKAEGRDPSVIYRSVEKSFLRLRILLKG